MPNVWELESLVSWAVAVVLLGVKVAAFVNCLSFSQESFTAADKLTKPAWAGILGVAVVVQILLVRSSPINLINLALTIATFVYLADVRPALAGLRRR